MKKIIYTIVVLICALGIVLLVNRQNATSETIEIGVIAPLTGPGAIFGTSLVKSVELSLRDLKNTKYKYELIIEDDGTNPAQSASAASKLVNVDKVKALITTTSGTGNSVAPIAEVAKIPHICTACADKKVATGKYNYTSTIQVEEEAKVFIDYAIKTGSKSLGLLSQIHPGINAVADAVKAEATKQSLPIVYEERYDGNNRDFKTIIAKAIEAKADIYFLQAFPPTLDIVGQELKTRGVKNIAGGAGAFFIAADPKIFEGTWLTEVISNQEFAERFKKEFPQIRFNQRAGLYGYDAFNMLVQGFEKEADMEEYLSNLKEFDGVAGKQYKNDGNYFRSLPGIWTIKNGQPAQIE